MEYDFICYGSHVNGGPFILRFTSLSDGVDEALMPTTTEIAGALDELFQSKDFKPLVFYTNQTVRVQMYPLPAPEES